MDDSNVMDPRENPTDTGHLPAAGEVGNGQVSYHDPVTQPTDDDVNEANELGTDAASPQTEDQQGPTPANGDAAGLS